jgi:hypothetical protein
MAADYLKVYHRMVRRRPTEPDIALSALAARSLAASGHGAPSPETG